MVNQTYFDEVPMEGTAATDPGAPADLLGVTIKGATPGQRLKSYLAQTGNPYCVKVGKTTVRLRFHDEERPLLEKLKSYFLSLRGSDFLQKMWYDEPDHRGEMKGAP